VLPGSCVEVSLEGNAGFNFFMLPPVSYSTILCWAGALLPTEFQMRGLPVCMYVSGGAAVGLYQTIFLLGAVWKFNIVVAIRLLLRLSLNSTEWNQHDWGLECQEAREMPLRDAAKCDKDLKIPVGCVGHASVLRLQPTDMVRAHGLRGMLGRQ